VRAIKNAVRVTLDFVRNGVNDRIHDEIVRMTGREARAPLAGGAPVSVGDGS
jgi:hypothetical protein